MSMTSLRAHCEEVIRLLDEALAEKPAEVTRDVDRAERLLARVRDALIDDLRRSRKSPRTALDRVNAVLSLVVGVEYPLGGLHRKVVAQARDALRSMLDEGLLPERKEAA